MDTPKFIQIATAGGGQKYNTDVYGLTTGGDVYAWVSVYNDPKVRDGSKTHLEWVKLENPA